MLRHISSRGGFTLVEVAVSAGIVALLAAILLPVTHAVRARAVSTVCFSHLKQLGLAFSLYQAQSGGFLPHEDNGETLPPFGCGWDTVLVSLAGDERLFGCPAEPFEPEVRSYKMNSLLEEGDRWFLPVSMVCDPAGTVLLFDGRVDNPGLRRLPKGTWNAAARRHQDQTNLLFIDGHAEGFSPPGSGPAWDGPGPFRWRAAPVR